MRLEELLAVGPETAPEKLFLDLPEDDDIALSPEEDVLDVPVAEERADLIQEEAQFALNWLQHRRANAVLNYHAGFLMRDRLTDPVADLLGKLFLKAAERGLVELTQEKLDAEVYSYKARRTAFLITPPIRRALKLIIKGAK